MKDTHNISSTPWYSLLERMKQKLFTVFQIEKEEVHVHFAL